MYFFGNYLLNKFGSYAKNDQVACMKELVPYELFNAYWPIFLRLIQHPILIIAFCNVCHIG